MMARKVQIWLSRHSGAKSPCIACTIRTKGSEARIMKTVAATSGAPMKAPKLASRLLNPPVEQVVSACITASNPLIPSPA